MKAMATPMSVLIVVGDRCRDYVVLDQNGLDLIDPELARERARLLPDDGLGELVKYFRWNNRHWPAPGLDDTRLS